MRLFEKLFAKRRQDRASAPLGPSSPRGAPLPLEPEFIPGNELEEQLLGVVEGRTELRALIASLLLAKVFVLFEAGAETPGPAPPLRPLVLPNSKGSFGLCLFTSPERALPALRAMPEFSCSPPVAFRSVLESAPGGVGLIINPGWKATLENPPQGLEEMRNELLGEERG